MPAYATPCAFDRLFAPAGAIPPARKLPLARQLNLLSRSCSLLWYNVAANHRWLAIGLFAPIGRCLNGICEETFFQGNRENSIKDGFAASVISSRGRQMPLVVQEILDDRSIAELLVRDPQEGIPSLILAYGEEVNGWLKKHCGADSAQDVFQEACLTASRRMNQFRAGSNPRTWFFMIAYYECKNYFRQLGNRSHERATANEAIDDIEQTRFGSPEEEASVTEYRNMIERLIEEIPWQLPRQLWQDRFTQNGRRPSQDYMTMFGQTENDINVAFSRGRSWLEERLQKVGIKL